MTAQINGACGVALYYPHNSIGSSARLKRSLLLWDSVRRIVPASHCWGGYRPFMCLADRSSARYAPYIAAF